MYTSIFFLYSLLPPIDNCNSQTAINEVLVKTPKRISDNIPFILSQLDRSIQINVDQELAELGLTRSQWTMLAVLYFVNGCNQTDLSELMDIGKGALGKLAHKLELKGWITRTTDQVDKRIVRLSISSPAQPLVKQLVDLLFEYTNLIQSEFTKEELALLRQMLNRLRSNVDGISLSQKWKSIKSKMISNSLLLNQN